MKKRCKAKADILELGMKKGDVRMLHEETLIRLSDQLEDMDKLKTEKKKAVSDAG